MKFCNFVRCCVVAACLALIGCASSPYQKENKQLSDSKLQMQIAQAKEILASSIEPRILYAGFAMHAQSKAFRQDVLLGAKAVQRMDTQAIVFKLANPVLGQEADLPYATEIASGLWRPGRNDVPTHTPVADVIQRRELARQIIGLRVGGRRGRNQTDMLGRHGQSRKRRDRLEPVERCLLDVVPQSENVGEEYGIEQACFRSPRQIDGVANVGQRQLRRPPVSPRRLVMAAALNKQVDVHLPSHATLALFFGHPRGVLSVLS